MRKITFALVTVLGAGMFVLMLERHSMAPQLAAERARAHQFAAVIADCANGGAFTIAGQLIQCKQK